MRVRGKAPLVKTNQTIRGTRRRIYPSEKKIQEIGPRFHRSPRTQTAQTDDGQDRPQISNDFFLKSEDISEAPPCSLFGSLARGSMNQGDSYSHEPISSEKERVPSND